MRIRKYMKLLKITTILSLAASALTGCTDYPIYDIMHPSYRKFVSLTTDWTNRGSGIEIPASYTVKVGDYSTTLSGITNSAENLFAEGQHIIHIWNTADNITVSGMTATADYMSGDLGWFFTGIQEIAIEKDRDYSIIVPMQQQVRQLTLELDVTGDAKDRLIGICATLSGVAGTLNIDNGMHGTPSIITLTFAEDTSDGKWKVTVRLLGITGNSQILTLNLHFADSNPSSCTLSSDLSSLFATFNADKKTPFTLSALLVETPSGAGYITTITDWIHGKTSVGTAD